MPRKDPDLLKVVNASGFLLQLRLEEQVRQLRSSSRWELFPSEHHWLHPESKESGFIDLIIGYGIVRLVIECKRPKEASWLFLTPKGASSRAVRFRAFWTDRVAGGPDLAGWDDFVLDPPSPQAMFCTLRGQADRDQPMLERIAGGLLESVEALGYEELRLGPAREHAPDRRVYFPLIVTTAELEVCAFETGDIDLATGTLPDADFESVPWVRFRKGLARPPATTKAQDLWRANQEKERTVLIVQAKALDQLLQDWDVRAASGEEWPFTVARRLAEIRE